MRSSIFLLERESVRLHIKFTLYEKLIDLQGVIVWKKPYSGGYMYGYDFDENVEIEHLIVEELKLRRRSEIASEKRYKGRIKVVFERIRHKSTIYLIF